MKNKKLMGLTVMALVVAMSLCACGKDDVNTENTSGYEQTANESTGDSLERTLDATEDSVSESSEAEVPKETSAEESTETIEPTKEVEETTEATKESEEAIASTESTKESVAPSKEQESAEQTTESKEQESVAPSKEETKPSQEASKPSVSAPSTEQTKPSQEASKPSASAPSVEQTQPSAPVVHTCNFNTGSVTKAATCKEEGVLTYTCSCGKSKTEPIGKTSHNYVTDSKAAGCAEAGYEKTACSMCGDVQSEKTIAATGHSLYEWWFHEPDCTYAGDMHYMKCHNCTYQEELPLGALGHSPDAGTVIHAATCTSKSLIVHSCTRCGCTLPDSEGAVDPNNHYWAYDQEELIWYCAACGITK